HRRRPHRLAAAKDRRRPRGAADLHGARGRLHDARSRRGGRGMKWTSVRVRLTLWNVLVLAVVMTGFGSAVGYTLRATQSAAVARDWAQRARRVAAGWARFDANAAPSGRAPGADARRPPLAGGTASRRPDRWGARPDGSRGPATDPNAARDFRRPRI